MVDETIGPFVCADVSQRQRGIVRRIAAFFTPEVIYQTLIPLVSQQSGISLRALDWLVTNYAKKHNIVCTTRDGQLFNIYHGYKVALSHFRRRNFDPFRRRVRMPVCVDGTVVCESTVGQCNFLYWADANGVLDYAIEHAKSIEGDMNLASAMHKAERRAARECGKPHRRRELSRAPSSKCSVYSVETHIVFDKVADESDTE